MDSIIETSVEVKTNIATQIFPKIISTGKSELSSNYIVQYDTEITSLTDAVADIMINGLIDELEVVRIHPTEVVLIRQFDNGGLIKISFANGKRQFIFFSYKEKD